MKSRFSLLLAPALLLALPALAQADSKPAPTVTDVASKTYLGTVKAGDHLAFVVKPSDKSIAVTELTTNTLEADCVKAVARAPGWLQHHLREALRKMEVKVRPGFCKVINAADAKTVDEVAWLTAHLSPQDLKYTKPEYVSKNAQLLYEADKDLDYVELLDKGVAGTDKDYYTTAKYQVAKGGTVSSVEIPRDIYYWWVVHPLLDLEVVTHVSPLTGKAADPPTGVSWREFFWAKTGLTPGRHYILNTPNVITDSDLSAMNLGSVKAHASLSPSLVGGNPVVRGGSANEPVLLHYSLSRGSCNAKRPMPDGIYLVTSIPLEKAGSATNKLLENLLVAGPGRTKLRKGDPESYVGCASTRSYKSRKVLIIRDKLPLGLSADPNEALLKKNGYTPEVLSSTSVAALITGLKLTVISSNTACTKNADCTLANETCSKSKCVNSGPFINPLYNKIVVPSGQPRALYKLLSDKRKVFEGFVANGGVFQLHGATAEADDWSDLTMPGGFKIKKQNSSNALTSISAYGNPLLRDVLKGVKVLWTGERRCTKHSTASCLDGDRTLAQSPDAIDRVGWWSSQMIDRSVGEYGCLHDLDFSSQCPSPKTAERSWYPQRIVMHHYGNCGEIQDVVGAASRTALIPSLLTHSIEDHVWNEFYAGDGQWYPYDTGWSDTAMRVGHWGVSGDGDAGGGKENAAMIAWRGDGQIVELFGRYKAQWKDSKIDYEYSQYLTLEVTVLDANRKPVDGAVVSMLSEYYYSAQAAVKATFGVTGADGKVTLKLGDKRNFYINIYSTLGHYPQKLDLSKYLVTDPNSFKLVVSKAEAKAGAKLSKTFTLSGIDGSGNAYKSLPAPVARSKTWPTPSAEATTYKLAMDLGAPAEFRNGHNPMSARNFFETVTPGKAHFYLTDAAGYENFKAGKPFDAAVIKEDSSTASGLTFALPDATTQWVLIASNTHRARFNELVSAKLTLQEIKPAGTVPTPPQTDDGTGCNCAVSDRPARLTGLSWLLLLGLIPLVRRRG